MLDFRLAYWFSVHKSLVTGTQIDKLNLSVMKKEKVEASVTTLRKLLNVNH